MADVSIANLPAFVGSGGAVGDLLAMVDTSDTSESPLGTTKRITFQQILAVIPNAVRIGGKLVVQTSLADTIVDIENDDTVNGYGMVITAGDTVHYGLRVRNGAATADSFVVWSDRVSIPTRLEIDNSLSPGNAILVLRHTGTVIGTFVSDASNNLTIARGADNVAALSVNRVNGQVNIFGATVIGTDPGGAQFLRVGGAANISGNLLVGSVTTGPLTASGTVSLTGGATISALVATGTARVSTGPLIVGTDPGGTQNLRVNGGAIITGGELHVDVTLSGERAELINRDPNSQGLWVQGGGATPSHETAMFANAVANVLFVVYDPVGALLTALKLWANDASGVGAIHNVAASASNTIPAGGRALYLV